MRIGVVIPTFDQFATGEIFARMVRTVEELGYHSAWFGDHVIMPQSAPDYMEPMWLDALTCAIHGLGLTTRIAFGTDVLVAPYRDPRLLAKMAATAAQLAGGRLQLGLGIGWMEDEFALLGSPPFAERAAVTEEYVAVIRALFESEGPVAHQGKWVSFEGAMFEPRPAVPLPLVIGGNHAKAMRRAALLGDGWHPLFMKEAEYAAGRAEIERIRKEAGIARPFLFSYSAPQGKVTDAPPDRAGVRRQGRGGIELCPALPRRCRGPRALHRHRRAVARRLPRFRRGRGRAAGHPLRRAARPVYRRRRLLRPAPPLRRRGAALVPSVDNSRIITYL